MWRICITSSCTVIAKEKAASSKLSTSLPSYRNTGIMLSVLLQLWCPACLPLQYSMKQQLPSNWCGGSQGNSLGKLFKANWSGAIESVAPLRNYLPCPAPALSQPTTMKSRATVTMYFGNNSLSKCWMTMIVCQNIFYTPTKFFESML